MLRLFTFLLFTTSALPAGAYSVKDIELSDYEYSRYVRPQLISITQDYQSLLTQINPELVVLKPFFNIYRNLTREQYRIKEQCGRTQVNLECQKALEYSIDQISRGLASTLAPINYSDKKFLTADGMALAMQAQGRFFNSFHALQIKYENTYYLYLAKTTKPLSFDFLLRDLHTSFIAFNDFILKSNDNRFSAEFNTFWSDFIKVVQLEILPENKKNLFIQKINDLNLRLNFLNVVLTKRSHPIPKAAQTIVKVIHSRWNNILKVTLKRQR